jgi:hypothetical protein
VRRPPEKVRPEFIKIPQQLFDRLRDVTLLADIMFVNGLPMFITKSRKIGLLTTEFLPSRTADSLYKHLVKVVRFYKRVGFLIRICLMDMEFEVLENKTVSEACELHCGARARR